MVGVTGIEPEIPVEHTYGDRHQVVDVRERLEALRHFERTSQLARLEHRTTSIARGTHVIVAALTGYGTHAQTTETAHFSWLCHGPENVFAVLLSMPFLASFDLASEPVKRTRPPASDLDRTSLDASGVGTYVRQRGQERSEPGKYPVHYCPAAHRQKRHCSDEGSH